MPVRIIILNILDYEFLAFLLSCFIVIYRLLNSISIVNSVDKKHFNVNYLISAADFLSYADQSPVPANTGQSNFSKRKPPGQTLYFVPPVTPPVSPQGP